LPPAKDRAVGKHFLCRPLLKAVGKGFFAECPTILAGGKERQSTKTSFVDCLAGGKEKLVAKVAGSLRRPPPSPLPPAKPLGSRQR